MTTTVEPNLARAIETVTSHLHPTPSWDVADHSYPTGREEVWRFTPVRTMAPLLDDAAGAAALVWDADLPDGASATAISAEQARQLAVDPPVDRVAALAAANSDGSAVLVEVPEGVELAGPVTIRLGGPGVGRTAFGSVVLRIGANAVATVIVKHEGHAWLATKTDVLVGAGAQLNLVSVQDWESDSLHGGQVSLRVGRDARVRTIQASLGGKLVRLIERAVYDGPGGELEQFGVYFVDGGNHVEHRMFIDHNAPHTVSRVDYRGALQGKGAHSVWVGDVLIRKVAEDIDTYEANKNLVLTEGCRADSVPNLEIETGQIRGAGHSSSTGRFDDEQLFYLMSRGVPEVEARRLVVHGFFYDIIRRIGVPEIEHRLMEVVERELEVITAVRSEDHR